MPNSSSFNTSTKRNFYNWDVPSGVPSNPLPKPTPPQLSPSKEPAFMHPIDTFEKAVEKPIDNIIDVGKSAVNTLENGFNYLRVGAENIENTVSTDFKIVENYAIEAVNYGERIGKDLFNILKLTGSGAEWIISHYKLILLGSGVYLGARFYNEVKQVL